MNTREYRKRKQLEEERHEAIQRVKTTSIIYLCTLPLTKLAKIVATSRNGVRKISVDDPGLRHFAGSAL
jgi:hypothetical protein